MKIFVLGGYGKTALPAIKLLEKSELVSGFAIAGRNLVRAEEAMAEVGEKAKPVQVDGTNEDQLVSLLEGYDMLMNVAFSDSISPAIRAAIRTGVHYCDVVAWGDFLGSALELAPEAEAAGITAVVAAGISPCISNLMGVYSARQLEEVEQLQTGRAEILDFGSGEELTPHQWRKEPEESLTALIAFKSFIGWMLQKLEKDGSRDVLDFCDGQWQEMDPIKNGLVIPLADGGAARAYPYFSGDDAWGLLPSDLARMSPAEIWFSPFPPHLQNLLREFALQMLVGKLDSETATKTFYDTICADPHRWLTSPEDFDLFTKMWVRAVGYKGGRPARHTCWFTAPMWDHGGYFLTSVALAAAVLKILRGEMQERGVISAEKAFDPHSFFDEVVDLLPEPLPDGKLIHESFEWIK